ncbi:MAG: glycosyltransferase family 4 protein, partial [Planctomycetota bacterium]
MNILHLFSNHKLTGPAEPVVRLAAALAERGHEVMLAHSPPPRQRSGDIDSAAERYGVDTITAFRLPKHFRPASIWRDARALARCIDHRAFDIVHCHLINDHLTGALAARRSRSRPRIVRTNHDAVPLARRLR